jgi:pimeloyl-ACP methyl ester carboxylesterase
MRETHLLTKVITHSMKISWHLLPVRLLLLLTIQHDNGEFKMKPILKKNIQTKYGNFEYSQSGEGSPAVVLINGGSGPIEGWFKVFHELAEETTVLAYNRLGVGKSDKPSSPQHGNAIVRSLRELLADVNISPPYIIVGHSLGGLYANLFARQYAEDTVGVILLDASHPLDLKLNQMQSPFIQKLNKMLGIFDSFSKHRKWNEVNYVVETARQIEQSADFPDIPLFIVSGGKKSSFTPDHVYQIRAKNQIDLVRLSTQGRQIVASKSGHFPQLSEPDVVIGTVKECLQLVKNNIPTT